MTDNTSPDCETLRALIPAYSVGATDPEETALVERLLPECPEAAAELAEYAALTDALAYTVPRVPPPEHLHDRLMAAVNAPRPAAQAVPTAAPRPAPAARPSPVSVSASAQRPAAGSARRSRVLPFAIAAAAVAAALLIISNIYWVNQVNALRQQQDALVSLLRDQRDALASLGTGRAQRLQLASTDAGAPGMLATVLYNPSSSTALLYTAELPPLAPDQTYQVWLIPSGANPVSAGVFQVDANGVGVLIIQADAPMDDYGTVAISTEPAGGSPQPTTNPVAAAQLG
jgi:anti-sigma-K factor RskA